MDLVRLRLVFAKQGPAALLSHLELLTAWERALRRARVPLAFTKGFNPHPQMVFALPLAVGVASRREYLDVELEQPVDLSELKVRISRQLPEGLELLDAAWVGEGEPSLMASVKAASYHVEVELTSPSAGKLEAELGEAMRQLEAAGKTDSLPGQVYQITGQVQERILRLQMTVQAGSQGNVKPEQVVQALVQRLGVGFRPESLRVERQQVIIRP